MGKARKGSDSEDEFDEELGVAGGVSKGPTIASSRPRRAAAAKRIVLVPSDEEGEADDFPDIAKKELTKVSSARGQRDVDF